MGRPQKRVRQLVSLVFLYPARLPLSCSSTSILLVYLYPARLPLSYPFTRLFYSSTYFLPYSVTPLVYLYSPLLVYRLPNSSTSILPYLSTSSPLLAAILFPPAFN